MRETGLETALRFYAAAHATFEKLARVPGIDEPRPSNHPRLAGLRNGRIESFEKHRIFYKPEGDGIAIVRVLPGGRDIDRILAEESVVAEDADDD